MTGNGQGLRPRFPFEHCPAIRFLPGDGLIHPFEEGLPPGLTFPDLPIPLRQRSAGSLPAPVDGELYCAGHGCAGHAPVFRGVLDKCVYKGWNEDWYYLRPITSAISGFISRIFLKAGLPVLEASTTENETTFGYLVIAFIAGYSVDNFMKKPESIAQALWGVDSSRASSDSKDENKD